MNNQNFGKQKLFLAAALTGIVMAGCASQQEKPTEVATGECHGINGCKGKGECGGAGHECAGKNACKAKGWTKMTQTDCKTKGGTFKN